MYPSLLTTFNVENISLQNKSLLRITARWKWRGGGTKQLFNTSL